MINKILKFFDKWSLVFLFAIIICCLIKIYDNHKAFCYYKATEIEKHVHQWGKFDYSLTMKSDIWCNWHYYQKHFCVICNKAELIEIEIKK